jgi:glycosyltransferase involved in cell wall biosynthesis
VPAFSVIIPCCNERDHIAPLVRSILGQQLPYGELELIVADGMSDDGTREILNQLARMEPRIKVVDNPRRIVSTGLNAALALARGDVILRMDAHTDYAPDYVAECYAALIQSGADNVGGPWIAKGETLRERAIAAVFQSRFGTGGARGHDPNYTGPVDTVYLGCWRRSTFQRFGMFDEELVRNQDDEFNLRLLRGGGKIWQSARIRSWYRPRPSLRALFRQYMQYGYWKVRVIQKHRIPASWRHLAPGLFLLAAVILAFATPWSSIAAAALSILASLYAIANTTAAFLTAAHWGWKLLPILPVTFTCYHIAYGYGFLRGILDFVMLGYGPSRGYSELTRAAATRIPR